MPSNVKPATDEVVEGVRKQTAEPRYVCTKCGWCGDDTTRPKEHPAFEFTGFGFTGEVASNFRRCDYALLDVNATDRALIARIDADKQEIERLRARESDTTCKDRTGRAIRKGDMVVVPKSYPYYDGGALNYVGVVEWIFASWQVVLWCVNPDRRGISNGSNSGLDDEGNGGSVFEVIGNIGDGSDLAKRVLAVANA